MSERKRDDLAGLAEAVQLLMKSQQEAATAFAQAASKVGGAGTQVAELIAQAASQMAPPRDSAGRPDVADAMRRVQDHLGMASEIFRKAQDIFAQVMKPPPERTSAEDETVPPPPDDATKP